MTEGASLSTSAGDRVPGESFAGTIVALGASAGGLDALDRFFSALHPPTGAAFVVIQHLAPEHRTMMDTLLARHTRMPVSVASDGVALQGGHVYVIPPGTTMTVTQGRLRLAPRPVSGMTMPIDAFFESLAAEAAGRAIAIVLSGTGSDGSRGIQSLDEAGAWVLVQDPESSRFDGMPRSAIATGCVDHIATPEVLAAEVSELVASGEVRPERDPTRSWAPQGLEIDAALKLLTGMLRMDFGHYKPGTLLRRLERRMTALSLPTLDAYAAHLARTPAEVDALRQDLLIPVTSFFRDAEAFAALQERVLRPLVAARAGTPDETVRVWVVATATGQETYSVAMLLQELIDELAPTLKLKIFATDVEQTYLDRAAAGRYSDNEVQTIPPERLSRFFTATGDGAWQVKPELRQRIVFSRHDVLNDPPFTQLDLVSCRNMLIYLRPLAQDRVMRRLAYGLRPGGALLLGSSESPMAVAGHFSVLDGRQKLYRLDHRVPALAPDDLLPGRGASVRSAGRGSGRSPPAPRTPVRTASDLMQERYGPPALLITPERELLHLFGTVHQLLRFRDGDASLDVLQLLPEPLMPVVATLTHAAMREGAPQRSRPVPLHPPHRVSGAPEACRVAVWPIRGETDRVEQLLVCFETPSAEVPAPDAPELPDSLLEAKNNERIADLERELSTTRESLHETIQELGTANEELQATNEELMASNEELQSTNEELQSVNEELHTVNAEFQRKIVELNEANADLESLTRASRLPILFLDTEMRLTRFTPEAALLFSVRRTDVGRPLTDISHRLESLTLYDDLQRALLSQQTFRQELKDRDGRYWLVSAMPFAGANRESARLVVTCVDVSSLRDVRRLQSIVDALPEHVAVLDGTGAIEMINRAWRDFAQANGDIGLSTCGLGVNYLDVCRKASAHDEALQRLVSGLEDVLSGRKPSLVHFYPCHSPSEQRWFVMHAAPVAGGGCAISHFNLTAWVASDGAGGTLAK